MKTHTMLHRVLSVILSLSLSITFSTTATTAHAKTFSGDEYAAQSITSGVIIFVAGLLAGYVVDGVFIYATGYSGGELSSMAIERIVKLAKGCNDGTKIYVDKDGFSGTSGKFSIELLY